MRIWEIGTLNQPFMRDSYAEIKFWKKYLEINFSFFLTVYFVLPILFVLKLAFDRCISFVSFVWKCCAFNSIIFNLYYFQLFNFLKHYSSFSNKVLFFQSACFKLKTLKTFQIYSDCYLKICRSRKRRATLKIPSTVFQKNHFFGKTIGMNARAFRWF